MKYSRLPHLNKSLKITKKRNFFPYFKNPLEKKRFTKSPKFLWHKLKRVLKIFVLISFIISIVYIGYYFFFRSNYFVADNVVVFGAQRFVNSGDIYNMTVYNVTGKNLLTTNLRPFEETLRQNFLGAKNLYLKKTYPRTIELHIEERSPMAIIENSFSSDKYMVDEEGYVLGVVDVQFNDLPVLAYDGEIVIGSFVENELVPITNLIIKEANEHNVKISSMSYSLRYTKMYVENNIETYISNTKDVANSMRILSSFIKNLSVAEKKISKIDLRYDKVIVLYD